MDAQSVATLEAWPMIAKAFQSPSLFAAIISAVALVVSVLWLSFLRRRDSLLPPGPSPWPILGNLPDLGVLPYRYLAKLADKFGPVLTVWLGSIPSVIISSPELAREVLKTQDKFCSSRPLLPLHDLVTHGGVDIFFSPSNEHWRMLRRLAKMHSLSSRALRESLPVREREIRGMLDALAEVASSGDTRGVEVREYLNHATMNSILGLTVGKRYTYSAIRHAAATDGVNPREMIEAALQIDWEGRIAAIKAAAKTGESSHSSANSAAAIAEDELESAKVVAMIDETFKVIGAFNLGDVIPWLRPVDPQRIYSRGKRLSPSFEGFVRACIAERERMHETRRANAEERAVAAGNGEDEDVKSGEDHVTLGGGSTVAERVLIDDLLEMKSRGEEEVTERDIVMLCLDLINAGTDTTAKTAEWALAELASHPAMLERLQAEEIPYLQAVIKETLRHHPPVPLLVPHMTSATVSIGGYTIPPNTIVQINGWCLSHDPTVWTNPHEFDPSRFLGPSARDVTGQDYGVLPFGSGRRVCAGMDAGLDLSARILANILLRFDLKVPEDVLATGGVDLEEEFNVTMALAKPLRLVLKERKWAQV
ncbi:unnamed protein product [Closterium sp. NIES-53]